MADAESITTQSFEQADYMGAVCIPVRPNTHALINSEDYDLIAPYSWYLDHKGYAVRSTSAGGKPVTYRMHRVVAETPPGMQTDHLDRNRLNNRKGNLRVCTNSQNKMNSTSYRGSESRFKGVTRNGKSGWRARIDLNKVQYHLGTFSTQEQAAAAYNAKAVELFGEFARLNVIPNQEGAQP